MEFKNILKLVAILFLFQGTIVAFRRQRGTLNKGATGSNTKIIDRRRMVILITNTVFWGAVLFAVTYFV